MWTVDTVGYSIQICWQLQFLLKPLLIRFNPPQVSLSVLSFVFSLLFIPSLNVLRGFFFVSLNLLAVPRL